MRAIIAAALAAWGMAGAAEGQSPTGQDLTPDGRGAYIAVAGANELYEIRAAELAIEKAERPEVRAIAQTMLAEHRESLARLEEAARAEGLGDLFPPGMMPMHWDMLRRLQRSSGARFDERYLEQQQNTHEIALALHRNFVANGNSDRLKEFARATLPMVDRHIANLQASDP